ncbi:hypothetical protein CALCODRAFT_316523 [Calocera cornea HHB12733]|uniref:Uncharacterized protein n=1 Tax=Calocera cornea HHB12733 TaxID=1353952 RepID=A0A165FB03_9BASI|nr:hypothetical protein CALCODRAFT_316523 [Calocera cornea HHB12733]
MHKLAATVSKPERAATRRVWTSLGWASTQRLVSLALAARAGQLRIHYVTVLGNTLSQDAALRSYTSVCRFIEMIPNTTSLPRSKEDPYRLQYCTSRMPTTRTIPAPARIKLYSTATFQACA